MIREAVFSGQFYPADPAELDSQVEEMLFPVARKVDARGAMVPHAGYMFSGRTAGKVYSSVLPKSRIILLGPNHTGQGASVAVSEDVWRTPIGEIYPDEDFISQLLVSSDILSSDRIAHRGEHSIEVQLPFIKKVFPGAKIVPIAIRSIGISELLSLADELSGLLGPRDEETLIVASSDMTHYESRAYARQLDLMVLKEFKSLNAEGVIKTVEQNGISMCGSLAAALMLACCRRLGCDTAQIAEYTDSGRVTGDTEQVVGYAGVVVF